MISAVELQFIASTMVLAVLLTDNNPFDVLPYVGLATFGAFMWQFTPSTTTTSIETFSKQYSPYVL
jgi:ABC-type polysaccharide/polyol phosphate export permease